MKHEAQSDGSREVFRWLRVSRKEDVPPASRRYIDVALLDMNHAWPNLGHDAIVRTIGEIAEDARPALEEASLAVRVLSYDVRRRLQVPEGPGGRHEIYVGTGGPGHLDPPTTGSRSSRRASAKTRRGKRLFSVSSTRSQ